MHNNPKDLGMSSAPFLFIQEKGEDSTKVALRLTKAEVKTVVRFTGGCGYMSADDSEDLYRMFVEAFAGFKGAILFGGTRMISRIGFDIVPGITEVPPLIGENNPVAVLLGIIPKSQELKLSNKGLIVSDDKENDYFTIAHPIQDTCLLLQESVDGMLSWEDEFLECMRITEHLRYFANWSSLLVSYNGGGVTEKEILSTAKKGWPIMLVNNSGRISEKYAKDQEFLKAYPNVHVADRNVASIRMGLVKLGALPGESRLTLVGRKTS